MSEDHTYSTAEIRTIALAVIAGVFFGGVATGVAFPTLPLLDEKLVISAIMLSLILSANRIARLFMNTPAGTIIDRVGARKPMIFGLFTQALAPFGYVIGLHTPRPISERCRYSATCRCRASSSSSRGCSGGRQRVRLHRRVRHDHVRHDGQQPWSLGRATCAAAVAGVPDRARPRWTLDRSREHADGVSHRWRARAAGRDHRDGRVAGRSRRCGGPGGETPRSPGVARQ